MAPRVTIAPDATVIAITAKADGSKRRRTIGKKAVTDLDLLDFWCYWPGCSELLLPIERNDAYIERLLNKELEFWKLVQQNA